MKKWVRNFTVAAFLLTLAVAGSVSKSEAARYDSGFGDAHALKMIYSLELDAKEQTALTSALSTYGPAVKTAWQNLHAKRKQMNTDLKATTPDGSQLAADATAVANAKTQLKSARTQLNSALEAALTPAHLQQLRSQLTAQFQSSLDARTGRLLFRYARHLENQ